MSANVDSVLMGVGFDPAAARVTTIGTLSGGERGRVALGAAARDAGGSAAARRAHESPRSRHHRVARELSPHDGAHGGVHQPRPCISRGHGRTTCCTSRAASISRIPAASNTYSQPVQQQGGGGGGSRAAGPTSSTTARASPLLSPSPRVATQERPKRVHCPDGTSGDDGTPGGGGNLLTSPSGDGDDHFLGPSVGEFELLAGSGDDFAGRHRHPTSCPRWRMSRRSPLQRRPVYGDGGDDRSRGPKGGPTSSSSTAVPARLPRRRQAAPTTSVAN